jgi:hypothetical protein
MHAYRHQSFGLRPAHNPVLKKTGEEPRKNGDDVEAHRLMKAYPFTGRGKARANG